MDFLKVLEKMLEKDIHTLTESQKSFIKARQEYLNDDQKKKVQSILSGKTEKAVEPEEKEEKKILDGS